MLSALAAACLFAASPEAPSLVVLDLSAQGVEPQIASALGDAVVTEVSRHGYFHAMSSKEVQTLLGVERQRQLMGCTEESCLTELAGALGARFVLSGAVAKLGSVYQLSLQMVDTKKATTVARSARLAKDLETLRAQIPWAVAEATGTPLPPPPSHTLPYGLIIGGSAVAGVGGLVALGVFAEENQLQKEIDLGQTSGGVLKPLSYYYQQKQAYAAGNTIAFVMIAGGAALIGAGIYLNPSDNAASRVAVVPTANGAALVGVW